MMNFKFSEPIEPSVFYHYKPPTANSFGDQPNIPDEVAIEYVEIQPSLVHKVRRPRVNKWS